MNTSACNDVGAIGGGIPRTRKKKQHEERMDKHQRWFQYETYGTRASRGIEFEALLVHDHWIISRGRKWAQGKDKCATGYEQ